MSGVWKAYFPDDRHTADDAFVIKPRRFGPPIYDSESAAQRACEIDYDECDGWERGVGQDFSIVVIAPDGTETRWRARHEPSIEHVVDQEDEARAEGDEA